MAKRTPSTPAVPAVRPPAFDPDEPSASPLVRMLALAGPLGRTRMRDLAQAVHLPMPDGRAPTGERVGDLLSAALARGWIESRDQLGYGVAAAVERAAFVAAVRSGELLEWRHSLLELHGVGATRVYSRGLTVSMERPGDDARVARLLWCAPATVGERRWFAQRVGYRDGFEQALADAFGNPFDAGVLELLAPAWRAIVVERVLRRALVVPRPDHDDALSWARTACVDAPPTVAGAWAAATEQLFVAGFVEGRAFGRDGEPTDEAAAAAWLRLRWRAAEHLGWQGRGDEARALLDGHDDPVAGALRGQLAALDGDWAGAVSHFEAARRALREALGRRTGLLPLPLQWIHVVALLLAGEPASTEAARKLCRAEGKAAGAPGWFWGTLEAVAEVRLGDRAAESVTIVPSRAEGLAALSDALRAAWLRRAPEVPPPSAWRGPAAASAGKPASAGAVFDSWRESYAAAGYARLAAEFAVARALSEGGEPPAAGRTFAAAFTGEQPWRRALAAIASLSEDERRPGAASASTAAETRLIWIVDPAGGVDPADEIPEEFAALFEVVGHAGARAPTVAPYEQKRGPRGWGKPKAVPLARLAKTVTLTDADAQVARLLQKLPGNRWALDDEAALVALVGHPFVFFADAPDVAVELVSGPPELAVERSADGSRLKLSVTSELRAAYAPSERLDPYTGQASRVVPSPGAVLVRETPTRARVVRLLPAHRRIVELVGDGLELPAAEGGELLARALHAAAAHFAVQDDVASTVERVADGTLHAELAPAGSGVRLRLAVRPLGDDGPRALPGQGGARLLAEVRGERRAARRDLAAERALLERVLDALPVLGGANPALEWRLDDPQDALALIEALQALAAAGEPVRVDWPAGARLRVTRSHGSIDLRLKLAGTDDWLQVDGGLALDDGRVVAMRALLDAAAAHAGRYLPLGEGDYLAITAELRERIDALAALAQPAEGRGAAKAARGADAVRIDPVAALALDEIAPDAVIERDDAWAGRIARMREAAGLVFAPPSTLAAELRPYQRDGFAWMARLAHWGAGACLADDMGLGKTVQTLALLLHRAAEGAALVVAPTSVCANWAAEAARFAPTLRATLLFAADDRADTIAAAGPGDLVIASYGLLAQHDDAFAARAWATVVLDEAQAVKNADTRRAQAALRLAAGMRVAVTGTPVENRLDELWTLMRFLNPGLLGPRDRFAARFATPIERDRDARAAQRLRRLVRPFLLRRTKAEVLSDLPERTEIALRVEPSPAEAAFHAALREQALDAVSELAAQGSDARFHVLAQIMRLRRAACDPRLVVGAQAGPVPLAADGDAIAAPLPAAPAVEPPAGAKLDALAELVTELIENRHKALVFSQFTGFLDLAAERLSRQGVRFHRLDGATPAAARAERVAAFQGGDGDVFLISLKAGGAGLNLTAADYVILCDPWWNPAVEAQAAGRAHRIGQQRPVTVYRLLTADTIEERIVALHATKRAIADALLEGDGEGAQAGAGALDVDELIALMRGD